MTLHQHIADPGSAPPVLVLRAAVCLLACYVMSWSFKGVREVSKGSQLPPYMHMTTVFWFAVAAMSFQFLGYSGLRSSGEFCHSHFCWYLLALPSMATDAATSSRQGSFTTCTIICQRR